MNAIATAYCACVLCCGPTAPNPTASGKWPVEGVTIAAPRSVKLGTRVRVTVPGSSFNHVYTVQDRTAKRFDGRWDIFFNSHQTALKWGKKQVRVEVLAP